MFIDDKVGKISVGVKDEMYKVVYDYSDIPTIREFALSDTRIRCLSGPIGAGKSSGCVIEIMRQKLLSDYRNWER